MTHKKLNYLIIITLGAFFLLPRVVDAIGNGKEKPKTQKVTASSQIVTTRMDINNINALEANNGYSDYNLNSNLEGAEYPKGSGKNFIFESGFLWGGYPSPPTSSSQVYVGGSAYISGLQPGPIEASGQAAPNPTSDVRWSIYRVRPDVYPGGPTVDLSNDAAIEGESASDIRAQYESDWTNWPAAGTANDLGAPFTDVNGDGKYEPNIDIPGVPGADQTIFWVANDEDNTLTTGLYGTPPLGVEVHGTYWAYSQQGALGNMYFKKYDIINKGYQKYDIDSMFVSFWADVDLGYANDDLIGCDTTLSLQFWYNGAAVDPTYSPLPPPADGFDFFQGPLVQGAPTDSGIFNGKRVYGKRNLPMTAAYFFINGNANFGDPPQGQPTGATQFYNFFNGEYGLSGQEFQTPQGVKTKFAFPGDPVAGTGWIDGVTLPPADRRGGMSSGPFNMAPGDTQEVVVAEMVAGAIAGVDRLSAISLVKFYDETAQAAYDNFFQLATPPPAPQVNAVASNDKVILDWGENTSAVKATEDYSSKGYTFEGYNVYQLPYASATIDVAKRLATYDVVNGTHYIYDQYFDANQGTVLQHVSEFGNDSGIERSFTDSTDYFNSGKPLVNGIKYYFAVTSYAFNPNGVPHALENPISIITVTPHSNNPGSTPPSLGPISSSNVVHSGGAGAKVSVKVVNPSAVTGDKYQVSFHNETYSLGADAKWTDVTAASKKMAKAKDLTGSSISSTAAYSETKGHMMIHYLVDVESPNYDWCDGVKLQLPAGVVIDSAYEPISNNTGDPIPYTYDKSTNTLFYSIINPDSLMSSDSTVRSQDGVFAGGEDITLEVHPASVPVITQWHMYDDNFGSVYGYGGKLVDVSGTDTLSTIAKQVITQHQWNVTDMTTGKIVAQNQTIYSGQDIYAPVLYLSEFGINGPGGSTGSPGAAVGVAANPIFNGLQAAVDGNFSAPTTYGQVIINGTSHTGTEIVSSGYDISDFTIFGDDGTAATTLPIYGGAGGTTSITQLQQDYELRWTGVTGDTTINGQTVVITKSGGSIATIFGASNYSIADHPLNPNPGSTNPFTIRIPFQVWNIDKNEQVNLLLYDRNASKTQNPGVAADTFEVWNTRDRVYVWAVNTKYSTAVIDPTSSIVADSATWNWVFFGSNFHTGDVIDFIYNNPLQVGVDTYTFTVPATTYSDSLAKQNVAAINVFPNPYYGVNSQELNKYNRFVTFSHLPGTNTTIRIFNLAGYQVKMINHTNGTQFETWDLTNESGLPVGSGLYIAYIDMPKLGATKILKFAIIQEQQIPDHF